MLASYFQQAVAVDGEPGMPKRREYRNPSLAHQLSDNCRVEKMRWLTIVFQDVRLEKGNV